MKKAWKILLYTILFANNLYSQITINAHASAEIIETLNVNIISPLNFGKFSINDTQGKVIIDIKGFRNTIGEINLISSNYSPAIFEIKHDKRYKVKILLPSNIILSNITNDKYLEVSDFTYIIVNEKLYIGATLYVNNLYPSLYGIFNGNYKIIFSYE